MMKPITLAEIVAARIAAKRIEDDAIAARRELDTQIATLLQDPDKPEGSVSQKLDGLKVTVTYKVDRKADTERLQADWAKLPEPVTKAFKWKPEVSVSELRKLMGGDAAVAAAYITSKPGSPSVSIEVA